MDHHPNGPDVKPPSDPPLISPAVSETLAALDLPALDTAAARLARSYAEQIDSCTLAGEQAWALEKLGPKLLAVLNDLGATPRARAGRLPIGEGGQASVALSVLRGGAS